MSKEMSLKICFVPFAMTRRGPIDRLCPSMDCNLFLEKIGPYGDSRFTCLAEDAASRCPFLLPDREGLLITAETRVIE
jgi:hypothetical protein